MSKMSQLYAELTQSAAELGFESFEDAEKAGYRPDYNTGTLYLHEPTSDAMKEMNEAHEAWLKERDNILRRLKQLDNSLARLGIKNPTWKVVHDAYCFIKEKCND